MCTDEYREALTRDREGRGQAGAELARAAQAAGRGEDRAEHGDTQHGAELTQCVGAAGGDALELLGSVAEGEPRDGREEETQAGAGDEEGRYEVGIGDGRGDLGGEPADADRLQRDADGDDPPAAEAVGKQAGDGSGDGGSGGPGQAVDAGAERRVAHDRLQELGDQEDDAEHAHVGEQHGGAGGGEPAAADSDGGIIGWAARDSQIPNAAIRSPPPARLPSTWALVQPWLLPRISPNTMPNKPAVASITPAGSRRPAPERLSRVSSSNGSTAMPMGTLIQKIHCQDAASVTAPPMTGPSAAPRPAVAPQRPSAMPRRCGGVTLAMSVTVSGVTIAAPTPWTARAAISVPMLGASAEAALAAVNTVMPMIIRRRRPNRSPSAAPVSSSTAKVSV